MTVLCDIIRVVLICLIVHLFFSFFFHCGVCVCGGCVCVCVHSSICAHIDDRYTSVFKMVSLNLELTDSAKLIVHLASMIFLSLKLIFSSGITKPCLHCLTFTHEQEC